ncbi:MAG: ATP-binding protein [Gammaproteobacteria bacterium]|nr:ATP-binding protein [Gammaproteobacteria bacterium]
MLVAFAMTNYACFRDRQEISMEAPVRSPRDDVYAFHTGIRRFPRLNRISAIYGPNGSGKSRFVQGLDFAQNFVIGSSRESQSGEQIRHVPFLFDSETREQPTTFEACFVQDETTYEYGFAVDRTRVHEEWLLAWPPGGRMRRLLERTFDAETGEDRWFFGPSVRGHKELWRASTRPNSLLVSTAVQLNSETFQPVVDWFRNLRVLGAGALHPSYTVENVDRSTDFKDRVLALLNDADISVTDITTHVEKRRLDQFNPRPPPTLTDGLDDSSVIVLFDVNFEHSPSRTGGRHVVNIDDESDGTQRLFAFAGPWLDILDKNRIVVIDELDRSLHPLLVAYLIRRINSAGAPEERKCAQLVATLHDVSLLRDVLDRSQIWFTNKDRHSEAASVTPLSDFSPRPREALVRGYLGGRYGGVPIIGESELDGPKAPRD